MKEAIESTCTQLPPHPAEEIAVWLCLILIICVVLAGVKFVWMIWMDF